MKGGLKAPGLYMLRNERGFTLLELLLAASIMSVLLVGLYLTFFSITGSRARIDSTLENARQVRRFMDVMATEVRSSFYNKKSERTLFEGEFFERRGRAGSKVAFTWFSYPLAGSRATGRPASELVAVSYFLELEPGVEYEASGREGGLDRAGLLYKTRWNPYGDKDNGYRAEVMENVESFLLSYFTGTEWVKSWDASEEKKLPEAVKIELALMEGEGSIKRYSYIVRTAMGSL